jgi:hypothetical protein
LLSLTKLVPLTVIGMGYFELLPKNLLFLIIATAAASKCLAQSHELANLVIFVFYLRVEIQNIVFTCFHIVFCRDLTMVDRGDNVVAVVYLESARVAVNLFHNDIHTEPIVAT